MSDKNFKAIRKQLRNVVRELLPEVLTEELKTSVAKDLSDELRVRLTSLETDVRNTMRDMTERQKDTLGYLVRQATLPQPPVAAEPAPATSETAAPALETILAETAPVQE